LNVLMHDIPSPHITQCESNCVIKNSSTYLTKSATSILALALLLPALLELKGSEAVKLERGLRAYSGVLKKESLAADSLARAAARSGSS